MAPWKHAKRSVENMGGDFDQHLKSHMFLNRTKDAVPQKSHRFLLHSHDAGARLLAMAYPHGPDAGAIVENHLRDDLGRSDIRLADWLSAMDPAMLPSPIASKAVLAGKTPKEAGIAIAERMGLSDSSIPRQVCEFLAMPDSLAPDIPAQIRRLAFRHSMGAWLAEACLGVVHEVRGRGSVSMTIGIREIAEMAIVGELGGIPPYLAVSRCITRELTPGE